MPEWFTNLAYITLAAGMILFLGAIGLVLVVGSYSAVKNWLEERRRGK